MTWWYQIPKLYNNISEKIASNQKEKKKESVLYPIFIWLLLNFRNFSAKHKEPTLTRWAQEKTRLEKINQNPDWSLVWYIFNTNYTLAHKHTEPDIHIHYYIG